MNRFSGKDAKLNKLRRFTKFIPLIIGLIVVAIFIIGVNYVSATSIDSQQDSLERAIAKDVAQCYAVEGAYPADLNYLSEHYGLTYDDSLFYVDYQSIGSNIYPDITVIRVNERGHE